MKVILSFCAGCGMLLESGKGLQPEPSCDNCGAPVKEAGERVEGEFEEKEARQLMVATFGGVGQ